MKKSGVFNGQNRLNKFITLMNHMNNYEKEMLVAQAVLYAKSGTALSDGRDKL